jgi:hypothetical protein
MRKIGLRVRRGLEKELDWKKNLQIYGAGAKSQERPTLVVGRKPNVKSQASAK